MKNPLKISFSTIGALLILFFLFREIAFEDLLVRIEAINWLYIFPAFFCYLLANISRSYRFNILLDERVGISQFLPITLVHNFFNALLPFRIGELSYFYLIKKYHADINLGVAAFSFLSARVFDVLSAAGANEVLKGKLPHLGVHHRKKQQSLSGLRLLC